VGEEMGIQPRIKQFPMQPGDVERTYADISKARALLGYNPKWEFREGIREFVNWFRAGLPANSP
jgi:UDP-glucuronate 4-epimerase